MGSTDYVSYGFALIVLSGGLLGYVKAGMSCSTADLSVASHANAHDYVTVSIDYLIMMSLWVK